MSAPRPWRLAALLAALLVALPAWAERSPAPAGRIAAVVDARHAGAAGARVGGVPTYRTIGEALAAAPPGGRYLVLVRAGRYREKLSVERPGVTLRGEGRDVTVLTFDAAADTPRPEGGTYGTRGSFTLRVAAPDFHAEALTIENAFDYPANAALPPDDARRYRNPQAVALLLDAGSDRAVFRDCRVSGHQDTLFADAGRAYFRGCQILGHVDFVFGAGRVLFEECDLVSLDRGRSPNGYVTAPSTPAGQRYGFVFLRSRLLKESPAMAAGSVLLGRPWHPGADPRAVGSAVFLDCWLDDHVAADGWAGMGSTTPAGERVWFRAEDARFREYGSRGPGALRSAARPRLTAREARAYRPRRVLAGWRP